MYRQASVLHLRTFSSYSISSPKSFPFFTFSALCRCLSRSYSLSTSLKPFGRSTCSKIQERTREFGTLDSYKKGRNEIETFFAEEGVSWKSLGVSDELCSALCNAGLERPSMIQAACVSHIFSDNDVIVAAETGSGKTHSYLVPLIDKLRSCISSPKESDETEATSASPILSLVLCPNVMLCEQVVHMSNCLHDSHGKPLLSVFAICGRQGWPIVRPDIIVSTPAALLNWLYTFDAEKRRRPEFLQDVKYVVFDEADMLLCGSFENQVIRLINMFRYEEKILSKSEVSLDRSMALQVSSHMLSESDSDDCEDTEEDSNVEKFSDVKAKDDGIVRGKDWRRVRKFYSRSKQYIFVAATLPENGKKTAGGLLKRMFPDAIWVSGNYLHCHSPRLEQRWTEVTVDTQVDALVDAVKQSFKSKHLDSGVIRTMVFANTVDSVQAVSKILQTIGIECMSYHSETSLDERMKNLTNFRERGGVFVCTDAAARGLDVPNVSHVIQAEFATSAVDFLHRVGRTGRAGQFGVVTSLYTSSNRDLVSAVRQAGKLGLPVEKAFSRKRSFRNKLKKNGQKGSVGEQVLMQNKGSREASRDVVEQALT